MKKYLFFFLALSIYSFFSCTKISTTEVGNSLIPPIDGINTFDTIIDVSTENVSLDSTRISRLQEMVLGNIDNDPIMGKTKAIINAQLVPTFFPHFFEVGKDSLFLDSAVLVLSYRGLWGNSNNPMNFKIFEISQSSILKVDSLYRTTSSVNVAQEIGNATIANPSKLVDSVFPYREAAANQIRLKLNNSFGLKLLKQFDSSNAYSSDAQFSSTFRGFSIVPQDGSNTLLRVSLTDTNTKVALYYRYIQRDSTRDTTVRYFRFNTTTSAAQNNIIRNRVGTEVQQYLNNTGVDSLLHLQAGPGNYIRIKTPGLNGLSNRLIHRAELIMEQEWHNTSTDTLFTVPNLFLCAVSDRTDSAYYRFHIPRDISLGQDGSVSNLTSFGGYPIYKNDLFGNRIASYAFNISRYVQGIATAKDKVFDLYLFAPTDDNIFLAQGNFLSYPIFSSLLNTPAVGRVRLIGGNSLRQNRKMRIRIIYSKL